LPLELGRYAGLNAASPHSGQGGATVLSAVIVNLEPRRKVKANHLYEVRPRKDRLGVDLISDVLPFGRLYP
jgi:hypothetical protein